VPVQPYLFFDGRCEEALNFYSSALGAKVDMLTRFKDCPEPANPVASQPAMLDKIMHASFHVGESALMASDGRCLGKPAFQGFSLSLAMPTELDAQRVFQLLGEGGQVQMPLSKTFFSSSFGMVADKFGVSWMVMVQ
jgi:PhnB protein